jgi:hypothetical protein
LSCHACAAMLSRSSSRQRPCNAAHNSLELDYCCQHRTHRGGGQAHVVDSWASEVLGKAVHSTHTSQVPAVCTAQAKGAPRRKTCYAVYKALLLYELGVPCAGMRYR